MNELSEKDNQMKKSHCTSGLPDGNGFLNEKILKKILFAVVQQERIRRDIPNS